MYLKFPIVQWEDGQGFFTVSTASGLSASAYGPDPKKCCDQIRKYIVWKHDSDAYGLEPEFGEPHLDHFNVSIRTGYHVEDDFFPDERRTVIRVPVVWGYRDDDMVACTMPTLDARFHCRKPELIESMINGQVQNLLNGLEPRQFSRFLAPRNISVDSLNVKIKNRNHTPEKLKLPNLEAVAQRFGSRDHKSTFPQAWEREQLLTELQMRMDAPRGNLMILGNRGVGKSTLLVNVIRKLEKQRLASNQELNPDEPNLGFPDRFWFTSADRLIAGMKYLGEWEERLESVIEELRSVQGVLCFANLEQLVRLGGVEPLESIAAFLTPFLQNNELRIVVEANRGELDACRRLLPGFDSLFDLFEVPDFTRESARNVLLSIGNQQAMNARIGFDPAAADLTFRLFRRFFPYETFPGKCVHFWKELFSEARNATVPDSPQSTNTQTPEPPEFDLNLDDVISRFVRKTGLPEAIICDDFTISPQEVFSELSSRIIGQDEACWSVTHVVTRLKAGLNDPARPIGVQLFCGPTGVGKTEMAKTLADYMFGSGDHEHAVGGNQRLIRLDMSEYSGFGSAERLVMQPNGEPSKLIQQIREQPFVVLLLDEIEKASPEVFDVFMGVFDEGRLTDRWGRTTDFRSTIIIMTSNLGVRKSLPIGFESDTSEVYEKEVRNFFRPEFFNRFDLVVPFRQLSKAAIREITVVELKRIESRFGFESRRLTLAWDDQVIDYLGNLGFDQRLGARPLQRTIESRIVAPLSRTIAEKPKMTNSEIRILLVKRENSEAELGFKRATDKFSGFFACSSRN